MRIYQTTHPINLYSYSKLIQFMCRHSQMSCVCVDSQREEVSVNDHVVSMARDIKSPAGIASAVLAVCTLIVKGGQVGTTWRAAAACAFPTAAGPKQSCVSWLYPCSCCLRGVASASANCVRRVCSLLTLVAGCSAAREVLAALRAGSVCVDGCGLEALNVRIEGSWMFS